MNPDCPSARHAKVDQLLTQLRDGDRTPVDLFCQPQFLFANEAAHVVLPEKLAGKTVHSGAERCRPESRHPAPAQETAPSSVRSRSAIARLTQSVTAAEIFCVSKR